MVYSFEGWWIPDQKVRGWWIPDQKDLSQVADWDVCGLHEPTGWFLRHGRIRLGPCVKNFRGMF